MNALGRIKEMVKAMKHLKNRKIIFSIISVVIACIFIITPLAISGIQDDKLIQGNNTEEAQLEGTQEAKVVTVSQDDPAISGAGLQQQETGISPIDNAASVAIGYINAGMSKEDIITILIKDLDYTDTEAEIAYSKAGAQVTSTQENTVSEAVVEETSEEESTTHMTAKDRVNEGIIKRPTRKFFHRSFSRDREGNITYKKKVTEAETDTVKEMLSEGYSVEAIAGGFSKNNYSTKAIIAVFEKSDVSASDTYSALSKTEISKAETKAAKKPNAKFSNSKIFKNRKTNTETRIKNAKKDAVTGLLKDMKAAGFDVNGAIDDAVQDFKDSGLDTSEAYSAIRPVVKTVVAKNWKPSAKFLRRMGYKKGEESLAIANHKKLHPDYGEGEYSLAAAMLKAGYEKSEIHAEFKKTYSAKDILIIMSAGETRALNSQNTQTNSNSTNNIDNTNTQQDILQRNTNPIQI
ncbi:MAG: hypothetical protein KAS13_04185 [Candidatus Omnitrophica bacterium]|nr:hypothetical protein [Candidatus Omnitrophota bacterium]